MAEYISAEVLEKFIHDFHGNMPGLFKSELLWAIDKLPRANVVERKPGKWVSYIEDGYLECPFCGAATNCDGDESELHFCFSCGAKMEGVRNDV